MVTDMVLCLDPILRRFIVKASAVRDLIFDPSTKCGSCGEILQIVDSLIDNFPT